jgi:hypothetical protein
VIKSHGSRTRTGITGSQQQVQEEEGRLQRLANMSGVVGLMQRERARVEGLDTASLVEGDQQQTLNLVWALIYRYYRYRIRILYCNTVLPGSHEVSLLVEQEKLPRSGENAPLIHMKLKFRYRYFYAIFGLLLFIKLSDRCLIFPSVLSVQNVFFAQSVTGIILNSAIFLLLILLAKMDSVTAIKMSPLLVFIFR